MNRECFLDSVTGTLERTLKTFPHRRRACHRAAAIEPSSEARRADALA
jgi:hypothetical protein